MQSMFRLPWASEPTVMDKAAAFQKPRQMPHVDIPLLNKLKRKRTDSPEPTSPASAHLPKKWKCANADPKPVVQIAATDRSPKAQTKNMVVMTQASSNPPRKPSASGEMPARSSSEAVPKGTAPAVDAPPTSVGASQPVTDNSSTSPNVHAESSSTEGRMTPVQQCIEAQFNHQILLKHNELRLIEQELAKAQVALEQLRRCALIPYPGTTETSEAVSTGRGPALRPQAGYTRPTHATPWGVTDGPYTRHYAKWLLQDSKFDSFPEPPAFAHHHSYSMEGGRTTRGSFALDSGKVRSSRTSAVAMKLQALGESSAPTPKVDPLLHKRSTDGVWVRLYCEKCGHSQFNNTQGFLNHCRIKHHQIFKSHDEAAIACGRPVNPDEVNHVVPAKDPVPTPVSALPTPTSGAQLVHPLVKANPSKLSQPIPPRKLQSVQTPAGQLSKATDYFSTPVTQRSGTMSAGFVSSPQTPNLSALLSRKGLGTDLAKLVEESRKPIDLDSIESPISDDESTPTSAIPGATGPKGHPGVAMARLPSSSAFGPLQRPVSQRPVSRKGQQLDPVRVPPLENSGNGRALVVSPVDLSPNTVESNPGLVSDNDDDDDDDDAKSVPQLADHDGDFVMVEDGSDVEADGERRKGIKRVDVGEGEGLCAKSGPSGK